MTPISRSAGVVERDEQCVLGGPGVGIVDRLDVGDERLDTQLVPVELLSRNEVGAAALEVLGEQRIPRVRRGGLAHEGLNGVLGAHGRGGEHVVVRRPVDVDDHGVVAEQVGDGAADILENLGQVVLVAHGRGALEHGAKAGQRGEPAGSHQEEYRRGPASPQPLTSPNDLRALQEPTPGDQVAEEHDVATVDQDDLEVAPPQRSRGPPAVLDHPFLPHRVDLSAGHDTRGPSVAGEDGGGLGSPEPA